jgi:Rrf2 family protein
VASVFRVSEASSLGLHAAALLARSSGDRLRISDIARSLRASAAHLAKVLSRLEKAGLVRGTRGPAGGYALARPARDITLRDVYEAVEGPATVERCVFDVPVCSGGGCALGGFFRGVNRQVVSRLSRTRLSDVHIRIGVNDEIKA